jgi:chromosome segregation protein
MKIKNLDVIGFKSFADNLTLQFPEGICAVVGPNGCGKSNIVDALRWVMGEQSVKQLRGQSMEDVIFSGNEKKGPLNRAEVAITLINDNGNTPEEYRHFSEIMVSRRLFRSGESGYFINKQPCRLKDVQNLLMGTGVGSKTYAIIEQGRIGTLIDAGPEERRFFIEEAAGITRYKSRKKEALQKIQRTQQNLLRIHDVIVEVKRQINSLKRQARKAERYRAYEKQIEDLEIKLTGYQYEAVLADMQETDSLLASLRDTDFQHEAELAKLDAAMEQVKQERAAKHQRISEEKAQTYHLQRLMDRLEGDMEHNKKDLERLAREIEQLRAEVKEIEHKGQETIRECRGLEQQKDGLQQDIQKIEATLHQEATVERSLKEQLAKRTQDLETTKAQLINLLSRKATYQNILDNASHLRENLAKRLDHLEKEKGQTERELAELTKESGKTEEHHRTLQQSLNVTGEALATLEKRLGENRQALNHQVRKVQSAEAQRQKVRSRYGALKKMDENYEWFKEGVQVIMREWKSGNLDEAGICGLVADVIETAPSYEEAVEAALGETLQYVIVKNQQGAVKAIDYLQTHAAGRGGFIPMEAVRPLEDASNRTHPQEHDLLIHHMDIRKEYEAFVQVLLGHVTVAPDLEQAVRQWDKQRSPQTIVTPQGDRICPQGAVTGGSVESDRSGILAKKKELKDLAAQISHLESAVAVAKAKQKELETEAVALETEVQKARQAQTQKSQQLVELERQLYRLQERLKHTHRHLEILDLEAQQIAGERTDAEQELSKYEEVLTNLAKEVEAEESIMDRTKADLERISEKMEAVHETVVELKLKSTALRAEYDSAMNTLRRLTDFQHDWQEKLARLEHGVKQREEDRIATERALERDQAKMDDLYAELERMRERLAQSEAEYQAIEGALQESDQALAQVRTKQQETLQKIQQLELAQSERRMTRDHLIGRIQERYHQDIKALAREHVMEDFSPEETERALAACRERMARLGDVNLTAIQEYETLGERYRLLTEQRDDLIGAIEALHRVIRKINRVSLKQFMKTFKAVNEKLQEVFPKLFEGGAADLALTEPKRPLESGVSFLIRPPGKRLTRMSLLSGGEKALAAIALIFSLFLIKPTAFCVLDEIDAPLDEVNVSRFARLLGEIGKQSQVIMVTHNKQTMEMAEALFGVTMEEKGISKLVSLNLTK